MADRDVTAPQRGGQRAAFQDGGGSRRDYGARDCAEMVYGAFATVVAICVLSVSLVVSSCDPEPTVPAGPAGSGLTHTEQPPPAPAPQPPAVK